MLKSKHFLVAAALCLPLGVVSESAFAASAHNVQTNGGTRTNVNEASAMKPAGGMMAMPMHMKKKKKMHHMKKMM